MNKAFLATPVLLLSLAACGHTHYSAPSASHSAQASAAATEGATAAKDALATCLPKGTVVTESFLLNLASSKAARDQLAAECKIPKVTATYPATRHDKSANRTAFAEAVALSAGNAWYHKDFKTAQGRDDWANKVFPVILNTYRVK